MAKLKNALSLAALAATFLLLGTIGRSLMVSPEHLARIQADTRTPASQR